MESLSSPPLSSSQILPSLGLGLDPLDSISFSELAKHFHVPLIDAAKALGICPTALKRACRKNNIPRWPHRKIKSLDKAIESCRAELEIESDESIREKLTFDLLYFQQQRDYVMRGHYGSNSPKGSKKNTAAAASSASAPAHKSVKKNRSLSLPHIMEKSHRFPTALRTAYSSEGSDSDTDSMEDEICSGDDLRKSPKQSAMSAAAFSLANSRRPLPVSSCSSFSPRMASQNSGAPQLSPKSSPDSFFHSSAVVSSSFLTGNCVSPPATFSLPEPTVGNVQFSNSKFPLYLHPQQFPISSASPRDAVKQPCTEDSCFSSFKMTNGTSSSSPVPALTSRFLQTPLPHPHPPKDWKFEASPFQMNTPTHPRTPVSPASTHNNSWNEENSSAPNPTKISFIVNNINNPSTNSSANHSSSIFDHQAVETNPNPCRLPPIDAQFTWFSKQDLQHLHQHQLHHHHQKPNADEPMQQIPSVQNVLPSSMQLNALPSPQSNPWLCHPRPSYELKQSGPSPFFLF